MPATVFGTPSVAVELYVAFYGQAPGNPIYQNYIGLAATSSPLNLAVVIGSQFAGVADTALATRVLANIGITASTLPAASFNALQAAMAQAFAAYPAQRGIVVLNAMNLLAQLESNATFGAVAQAFNRYVANAYLFASDTGNTQSQAVGTTTTTSPLTVNAGDAVTGTPGNDTINANLFFNAPSGTFLQTLNSGDVVNGGAGTDLLNVGFNNVAGAQTISATLTSIEGIAVNATGTAATTLDLTNATGLATVSLNNGRAGGDITLGNVGSRLGTVTINRSDAGLTVTSTAAAVAGTADTVVLNLVQAGAGGRIAVNLVGYETINAVSTGYTDPAMANAVTLGYSEGATVRVSGTSSLDLRTGTNAVTVDGARLSGSASLSLDASLAASAVNLTGSSNGDRFILDANYAAVDTINGGGGVDTLRVAEAAVANVTDNQANLSNLELLELVTAASASAYAPTLFGGAGTLVFSSVASAANWTANYASGTSGLAVRVDETGNTLAVNASGSATTDLLNLTLGTSTTTAVTLGAAGGTFTSNGFETITIASSGAAGTGNTVASRIEMTASAATEVLNVTGTRDLTIAGTVRADQVNASSFTGNLSMGSVSESAGVAAGVVVTNNGVQITGGSGSDTLFGSDGADQIVGGAGNDRIQFGTGVSQGDIATGGAGTDQFRFVSAAQSAGTAQVVKITDFVAGTDKIALVGIGTVVSISAVTTGTVATADTLADVYAGAGATTGSTAASPAARVLTVSGGLQAGTFLVIDTNGNNSFTDTTDMLVNITGVTGTVATGDFVFA
ncbi:beta strand repeat-containing protein [Ramlibacter albus]|uniref:Calcium-binding protein n=1 Tax=Ramlibacter albus TaxID=2079448 RepID=A0A923M5F4_9BURK|nr:bluetail domain-containing putative surface protein [Ramlibacter albus]MBC5763164.1 hypothetical protein [Ramlibacter albus]